MDWLRMTGSSGDFHGRQGRKAQSSDDRPARPPDGNGKPELTEAAKGFTPPECLFWQSGYRQDSPCSCPGWARDPQWRPKKNVSIGGIVGTRVPELVFRYCWSRPEVDITTCGFVGSIPAPWDTLTLCLTQRPQISKYNGASGTRSMRCDAMRCDAVRMMRAPCHCG